MEINQDQQERIDQFLQGNLKGDALAEFLEAVKKNPILEKEWQMQKAMAEGIEFHGNKALRQRFQKIAQETKNKSKKGKPRQGKIIRFLLATAAAIALLIICLTFFFQQSSTDLFAQYYTPSTLTINRSQSIDNQLATIETLYNNQQYSQAIPLIQTILKTQPQNENIQLALGNSFLNIGKINEAIAQFQSIVDRNDPLYSDQARWFLALTHLKMDQVEKAKILLQFLANDSDADYHKEASEILKAL